MLDDDEDEVEGDDDEDELNSLFEQQIYSEGQQLEAGEIDEPVELLEPQYEVEQLLLKMDLMVVTELLEHYLIYNYLI